MKKWIVRAAAAGALAAILAIGLVRWLGREPHYGGRALSEWVYDLQDGNGKQREKAAEAIRALGPEGLPYLAATLTNSPPSSRGLLKKVASHVPDEVKRQLRRFYNPPDEVTSKIAALNALQMMGTNSASAVAAVEVVFLKQPHVAVSSYAAKTLNQMGTNSLPTLIAALDDGDYNVCSLACQGLANFHTNSAAAIPRLERIARDEIGPIASMAFYALSRVGDAAVPALTNLLSNTNATVRSQALYALTVIAPADAMVEAGILAATEDPDPEVRWRAVEALLGIYSENAEVQEVFRKGLNNPDPRIRAAAANAMGHRPRNAQTNLEALMKLTKDESPDVRAKAAFAIGQTGAFGSEALPHLEALTTDTNARVSASALQAINTIEESKKLRELDGN